MHYKRDFTIGMKETQAFYFCLVMSSWWKGILAFGVVGGLVGWMYQSWLTESWPGAEGLPFPLLMAVFTMAVAALAVVVSTRRKVRTQVRKSGRENYVQHLEIDGFGVHAAVGKDSAKVNFEQLYQVWETRRAFYVFLSANQAWLLPKAQMEDAAAESAQLREIFRTVVPSKKLRLKK